MRIEEKTYNLLPSHLKALFRKLPNHGSDEVLAGFPETGISAGGGMKDLQKGKLFQGETNPNITNTSGFGDFGSAARFFFCAKASQEERNAGLSGGVQLLDCAALVCYPSRSWVFAALNQRLLEDTVALAKKATAESMIQTSEGFVWSMCLCGSPTTDIFHPAIKSIIETETKLITKLETWNSSAQPHTNGCMAAAFGVTANGGNLASYAEFQSPLMRQTGISAKKDGRYMVDADLATSIKSWLTSAPVGGGQRMGVRNSHPT